MILQKLTAVGTDGSRVMLWFDDGSKMKVATRVVTGEGLYQGMTLTEDDLSRIMDAAQRASAKDRAVRIVSAAAISEKELRRRLIQKGERPEDACEAVEWLRDLGAIDDAAMAKRVVSRCVDKGYGKARIRQELYQKGVPKEYWDEALETVPDMTDAVDKFIAQKLRGREPDQKEIQRLIAALQRRGHGRETIRSALRRYSASMDALDYDT